MIFFCIVRRAGAISARQICYSAEFDSRPAQNIHIRSKYPQQTWKPYYNSKIVPAIHIRQQIPKNMVFYTCDSYFC
jgi:hypothetical protein